MLLRSTLPALAGIVVLWASPSASAQSNWVDWDDVTATRLVGNPATTTADDQEKDIAVADLDNDGDSDVIIVRKVPFSSPGGQPNVLLMNEGGILVERTSTLAPGFLSPDDARDVRTFHANADPWVDVVVATTFGDPIRLFINQGEDASGNWLGLVERLNWFSPAFPVANQFCAVYDGDVDNDGDQDLYFADYLTTLENRLLINDGNGFFTDETDTRFPGGGNNQVFGTGCFVHDFNNDGWADILQSSGSFEPISLLINDGTGNFPLKQILPSTAPYMVEEADFNNDNRTDIYVVDDGQDRILINDSTNPDGTINVTEIFVANSSRTANFGGNVHAEDIDNDGFMDIGVADVDVDIPGCTRFFSVLRNLRGLAGVDGLEDPNNAMTLHWNTQGTMDFDWLDLNGDGLMDMIQSSCNGTKVLMMRNSEIVTYCSSKTSSQGCTPFVVTVGVPSATSTDRFLVRGFDHVPVRSGLLVYGFARGNLNFHGGKLCVKAPIVRTSAKVAKSSSATTCAAGTVGRLTRNFNQVIQSGITPLLTVGQVVDAQWIQRDTFNTIAGFHDNMTDAVEFTIGP